ncbi:DUF6355 family natural product biosynthesis protein [Allokutzneria albata]|nr:DUF6355 family natural product biosynthesis protein [Allokutzneria albata]
MRLLSAALVLCASAVGLAGTAHATEERASAHPCGFFGLETYAYYNHCGSGNVLIHIDRIWPASDGEECVRPGYTPIGVLLFTKNAHYIRPC